MITQRLLVALGIFVGLLVAVGALEPCVAQIQGLTIDPAVCSQLQSRIDEIVSISRSETMSDREKVARLSESWSQSIAEMLKGGEQDPEMAKVIKDLIESIAQTLGKAKSTAGSPKGDSGAEAARDLRVLVERTKPYVAIMQLLCPDLKVPDAVTKRAPLDP
ncbi:MAG: hypothetical protein FJ118_12810 [Deltaproteobacteria bacterium]|nr:hypothetical protein [Deltaproteobacteria bacterium]